MMREYVYLDTGREGGMCSGVWNFLRMDHVFPMGGIVGFPFPRNEGTVWEVVAVRW